MRKDFYRGRMIITILVLIAIMGIVYAFLGANLQINGVSEIPASSWIVRFKENSVNVTSGSVSIDTSNNEQAATIDDDSNVSYKVRLSLPGDFYEFTVVVENKGSIDAMIDSVSSKLGNIEITTGTLPSYLNYKVTYSDGVAIAPKHLLAANTEETYKVRIEFKKDVTTAQLPTQAETLNLNFQVNYVQKDDTAVTVPHPVSFADDDWDTIVAAVQAGNTSTYQVGDTKTVDLGSTLGTHTLRVANTTTPAECSTTGFSQTACGLVLEFADIITTHVMNSTSTNVGGWQASEMRTYINSDIYNALPTALKNAIIDTTVVSGHGSTSGETNFVTTDKLYLLSPHEVLEDDDGNTSSGIDYYDTAYNNTRQLDYYRGLNVTTSSYLGAIKKINGSNSYWWLRSAYSYTANHFTDVSSAGNGNANFANDTNGVSPAFRLG